MNLKSVLSLGALRENAISISSNDLPFVSGIQIIQTTAGIKVQPLPGAAGRPNVTDVYSSALTNIVTSKSDKRTSWNFTFTEQTTEI